MDGSSHAHQLLKMNANHQQKNTTTKHMKNKIDRPKVFIDLVKGGDNEMTKK
jgi:hypothetical protein